MIWADYNYDYDYDYDYDDDYDYKALSTISLFGLYFILNREIVKLFLNGFQMI